MSQYVDHHVTYGVSSDHSAHSDKQQSVRKLVNEVDNDSR